MAARMQLKRDGMREFGGVGDGDGTILYPDCGGGYPSIYMC